MWHRFLITKLLLERFDRLWSEADAVTWAEQCGIDEGHSAELLKPGDYMLGSFTGISSIAKLYLVLYKYKQFLGCEKNSDYLKM